MSPQALEGYGLRLEPLAQEHAAELSQAAADGELWKLWFTSVPEPGQTASYIAKALEGQERGDMLPWAVRNLSNSQVVGTTRYHDIVASIDRVEIGYTWYARTWQRSYVNTGCKLLLMTHAFEEVGCKVVGFRTDKFNTVSQKAIEALGATKDGILRRFSARRDGSPRDSVMYSIVSHEWPEIKFHLQHRLSRHLQ